MRVIKSLDTIINKSCTDNVKTIRKLKLIEISALLVLSLITITICSKSSPLYPFNNWVDPNCFFTVGKAVLNGKVMYRDIYEQKGPLLYFIHTLAYLISNTTFLGVYILEIISCFGFLLISYKICLLFTDNIIYLFPVYCLCIYASRAFEQGDSAEELCLPLIALIFYFGIKCILQNEHIKYSSWFAIGVTSGAVLWIKFSLLGFYIGFGFFMLFMYLKNKWNKELLFSFLMLFLGIIAISAPVFIYFICNNSVNDLFKVYFYDNIFMYAVEDDKNKLIQLITHWYIGLRNLISIYLICCTFIFISCIFLWFRTKLLLLFYTLTFIFSFAFVFCGNCRAIYYCLIFSVFMPLGIIVIKILLSNSFQRKNMNTVYLFPLTLISSCILLFFLSPNTYLIKYSKEDLPQYKFAQIISQKEDATLLNYGWLDIGLYTVADITPNCKYFCGLNSRNPDIMDTQNDYVNNGKVDFIVTIYECDFELYDCIDIITFENQKNTETTYYLYQLKNS